MEEVVSVRREIEIEGQKFSIETGKVAKQADGAVVVRCGDTVVLVTACAQRAPRVGVDFLPLTVDYRENTYAGGKIPGGFFKREGRPNEKETLTSRLIDRPIRPLFPDGWNFETQVVALVLSFDQANDPDVLAVTGASAALCLSDIPFPGPLAAVRVGLIEDRLVVNPTNPQLENSRLDLVVCGTGREIVMVEAGAHEVPESVLVDAIFRGHEEVQRLVRMQQEMCEELAPVKRSVPERILPEEIVRQVRERLEAPLLEALRIPNKRQSYARVDELREALAAEIPEADADRRRLVRQAFGEVEHGIVRREILENRRRTDGRAFDQIRAITCEVGVLPRTHGSALFTRGETQALVTTTLGTSADAQKLDWLEGESHKRFMLHYNFPPFSVGEVKFLRGPGRREIGHGALAERALLPLMPTEDQFPYTTRLVSDILESNGSSSMASICGGALALMDAGVPLTSPVAGIAMGLVKEGSQYAVLTDIAGVEDHLGDMDFKVAGTERGVTALQMDIKITGVSRQIVTEALEQARRGRLFVLEKMEQALSAPRPNISPYAPRLFTIMIPKDKIGEVIGPGGKMIRSIIERTGTKIEIEDDGRVQIAAVDESAALKAKAIIEELTATAEIGRTYLGKIQRLTNFGAFVEIMPRVEGLLHISEVSHKRVADIRDELKEGDEILVKVIEVSGDRIRLSRKAVLKEKKAASN
jgi:polyribonucleotide nucleotidyltransferase